MVYNLACSFAGINLILANGSKSHISQELTFVNGETQHFLWVHTIVLPKNRELGKELAVY